MLSAVYVNQRKLNVKLGIKLGGANRGPAKNLGGREALFLSLMVTNCSGKRFFSRFNRIKNESKGRNIPGEVVHNKHLVH